jgi:small neutral amino acid transporter SnatA (MarC family)
VRLVHPINALIISVHPFGDRLAEGRGAAFVVLVAFFVSFICIRTSARLTRSVSWWPGGVQAGGVHLHHLVWGICLMLLAGFLAFAAPLRAPWWHLDAVAFGVGAGFTLDEFALWVRLSDVYWTEEGRSSVDAVVIALAFAGLVVIGTRPFGLDDPGSIWGTIGVIAFVFSFVVLAAAKGRPFLAVVGIFIPVFAIVGGVRVARPSSLWAKRRYDAKEMDRAHERYAPTTRLSRLGARASELFAGAPSEDQAG